MSKWDEVPYTEYIDVSKAGRYSINVSVLLRLVFKKNHYTQFDLKYIICAQ